MQAVTGPVAAERLCCVSSISDLNTGQLRGVFSCVVWESELSAHLRKVNCLTKQGDCFATSCIDMIQMIIFLFMSCLWCHLVLELYVDQTQRLSAGMCMSTCQHSRSVGPQLRQGTVVQAMVIMCALVGL